MNIYVVCEGEIGEKKVYRDWIPRVNSQLSYVSNIDEIVHNNFSILIGGGYPSYFDIIESAIFDVNEHGNIDRIVIAVDSEELDYQEKYDEIDEVVSGISCSCDVYIIIQYFCLETWGLGNKHIIRPQPQNAALRAYKNYFDIRVEDPELLPSYEKEELTRVRFAEKYLRRALNDKFRNLTYTKSNPSVLLHQKYFDRVKSRCLYTNHIKYFNNFLTAFH